MSDAENGEKVKGRDRFFYVPVPKAMGERIDKLLDKYGEKESILSINDFVRTAAREKIETWEKREASN